MEPGVLSHRDARSSSGLSGYAQGLVIALLTSFLVLVAPFGADKALAADPSRILFNNDNCELATALYTGAGSEADPYVISDSDSLWEVADCSLTNSAAAHFSISNDIDVSQAVYAPTASPIGNSTSPLTFRGVLHGNGYLISGISMSHDTDGVGLFYALQDSTVSELAISGSFVGGTGSSEAEWYVRTTGGLARAAFGKVVIDTVTVSGSVSGHHYIGGLIGWGVTDSIIDISFSANKASVIGVNVSGVLGVGAGGFLGWTAHEVNIVSSHNTGSVSTGTAAGGIVGIADGDATITSSYNTGPVHSRGDDAGGLVGIAFGDANISSSYNTGRVSGDDNIGGLIGRGVGTIYASFNSGAVSGDYDIGGLIGDAGTTTISNAYNTGAITATGTDIGGLIGEGADGDIFVENSYNTGVMSVTGDYSGLVGPGYAFTATSVYTDQVASASSATSYSATALADMKELTLYSGWDFDTIWGFGSCSDNNGLPMLRQLAQVGTYFGYSCGLDAAPASNPVASNPAVYEGPTSYQLDTEVVPRGTSVVLTGNNMDLVKAAKAGAVALSIQEQTATSLKLFVGQGVALGPATLYLTAINGTVYRLNAFTVIEGDASASYITDASASTIIKKVNAGSFKGYVALYALGYEGQRLSAKVGKDWVIVPSIPRQTSNLYRYVEFTGAGVNVAVRIYIDRVLVRTVYLTTK
jgi:hypothetical protein